MPKGGKREGAGRPKGAINKKSAEQIKAVEETGITPLDYLLDVMQDVSREERVRIDAAKAAAPYVHAKLTSTEISGPEGGDIPLSFNIEYFDPEDTAPE